MYQTELIDYYKKHYNKTIKPVFCHKECDVPVNCTYPHCKASYHYLMCNDCKKKTPLLCKVCQSLFSTASEGRFSKIYVLRQILSRSPRMLPLLSPLNFIKRYVIIPYLQNQSQIIIKKNSSSLKSCLRQIHFPSVGS